MKELSQALSAFTSAQELLEWLKDNGLLKDESANISEIAFSYAIAYSNPHVVEIFAAAATLQIQSAKDQAEKPKRQKKLTELEAGEEVVRQNQIREQSKTARQLAAQLKI